MSTSREIQRERGERQVRQQKNLTEAKAKVVSAGWGTELEIELQDDLKKKMNRRRIIGGIDAFEKWMITKPQPSK